jgi:hypothetical protein
MTRNPEEVFPSSDFVYVPNVPVFRTHSRIKGGKRVTVTEKDLEEIADRHNQSFDELGIAVPLTLGHTRQNADGEDVPETEQPPVVGWSVQYRIAPLENGEPALYCDWYIQKEHKDVLRSYPTRSVEYFINRKSFWPIALLRSSAPELELPILRYSVDSPSLAEPSVRFQITSPLTYSTCPQPTETEPMTKTKYEDDADKKKDAPQSEDDKAVADAQKKETKGAKQDASDLSDIKSKLDTLMAFVPLLEQLGQMMAMEGEGEGDEGGGEGDDLMKPAEDDAEGKKEVPPPKEMIDDKPEEKDARKEFEKPVNFDAGFGSSTNGFIPSMEKDKAKMAASDEVLKYKKEVDAQMAAMKAELDATRKVAEDLNKKNRRAEAEKLVYRMENEFGLELKSDKVRKEEIDTLTVLGPAEAAIYVERAKERYARKLPNSDAVKEVAKYAAEGEPELSPKTPQEAQERAMQIVKSGLTVEEFYKQMAGKK